MGLRQAGIARIGFRRLGAGAGLQAVLPIVTSGVFFADSTGAADTDANFGYNDADDALYSLQGGATYTATNDAANVVIKKAADARISLRLDGGGFPNRILLQNGSGASRDAILSKSLAGLSLGNSLTGNDAIITIDPGAISITTGSTGPSQVTIGWGSGPWVTFSGNANAVWGDGTAANPMIRFSSGSTTGLYCPASGAVGGAAGSAEKWRWDSVGMQITGSRLREAKGAAVASANTLTLGTDGNYFGITGNTQIQGITTANWQSGSRIRLELPSGITVVHSSGAPGGGAVAILLAAAADLVTSATTLLELVYNGTNWVQPRGGSLLDSLPATSVPGRSANSVGAAAAIAASADGDVLWRNGTTLGFGPLSKLASQTVLAGIISPAALSGTVNDWNPTGLSGANYINVNTTGGTCGLSGIAGGVAGRLLVMHHVGADVIVLKLEDAGSTAANRLVFASADYQVAPGDTLCWIYHGGSRNRWVLLPDITNNVTKTGNNTVTAGITQYGNYLGFGNFQIDDATTNGYLKVNAPIFLTKTSSPAQLTADVNNWNPTLTTDMYCTSDASRTVTGLAGGAAGRTLYLYNTGSNNIVLANNSGSSTAANRFDIGANATILPGGCLGIRYATSVSMWRAFSAYRVT